MKIKQVRAIDYYGHPRGHIYPHGQEWDYWDLREEQGAQIMVVDRDIPPQWKPANAIILVIDRYGLESSYLAEIEEDN